MLSLQNILEFLLQKPITFDLHLSPLNNNPSSKSHKCHFIFISYLNKFLAVVFIIWQLSNAIRPLHSYFTSQKLNLTHHAKSPAFKIHNKISRPKDTVLNASSFSLFFFPFLFTGKHHLLSALGDVASLCYTDAQTIMSPTLRLRHLQK